MKYYLYFVFHATDVSPLRMILKESKKTHCIFKLLIVISCITILCNSLVTVSKIVV